MKRLMITVGATVSDGDWMRRKLGRDHSLAVCQFPGCSLSTRDCRAPSSAVIFQHSVAQL